MTLRSLRAGDQFTVTAAVASVLGPSSFTIGDVDLPDRGLLVLGSAADGLRPGGLVTVRGTIALFDLDRFATDYGLTPPERYGKFEDRKILVVDGIRRWD